MSGWVYIFSGFVPLVMITWGATLRSPTSQPPRDPILMICACLFPPVLWIVALHRFLKTLIGLPGNVPLILTGFCALWFGAVVAGIPINQYQIAFSAWLFAIFEPILVYLSTEAYCRFQKTASNVNAK